MAFVLKSFPQILQSMASTVLAKSPLNDLNPGSALLTILEAAATEDFKQYYQMLQIINNFTLDKTTGVDLENRAIEFGLEGRLGETKAFGETTIGDSAITKVSTKIYAGLNGPVKGQFTVNVDNAVGFTASGSIIVGRNTTNVETVPYSSIAVGVNFSTFNLSSGLNNDHGSDETVILSQGGDRIIAAGTIVKVPPTDFAAAILFATNFESTILDGESEVTGVLATAVAASTTGNVPAGSIRDFDAKPFPTITVENIKAFTNATDTESDSKLRDRIKTSIQSLSRGTKDSIVNGVVGIVDSVDNKRVVSANLIDATTPTSIGKLFIDDGTGFEPDFDGQGLETVVGIATGGEQFLQLKLFPLVKALIETINLEPFAITNGLTLTYKVSNSSETIIFTNTDFQISGSATAQEVVTAINNKATLIEARTTDDSTGVEIRAKVNENEDIQVTGGSANAVSILNFPTDKIETLKLYKLDGNKITVLSKDGLTALVENTNPAPYDFSLTPTVLDIQIDGETMFTSEAQAGSGLNTLVDVKLGQKFTSTTVFDTKKVTFLSGTNIGLTADVASYDGVSTITLTGGLTVASTDKYQIEDIERIYFSNVAQVDFAAPASVTVQEIVDVINNQIKGLAMLSSSDSRVTLTSKLESSVNSKVRVFGGSANAIIGFPTTEVVGADRDFVLNRFNGQLELNAPLAANETITAGSRLTRGFIVGSVPQPYSLTNGDTITVEIDGGASQVITFLTADFSNINEASAAEVVAKINSSGVGLFAEVTVDNRVSIRTNTFDLVLGSIEIEGVTGTATTLGFTVESTVSNIRTHTAFLTASSTGPYVFVEADRLVVVLDNDIVSRTFDIRMDLGGTVIAESVPNTSFTADITSISQNFTNKFITDDVLNGFQIIWKTGANAGSTETISDYDAGTGIITMSGALGNAISASDTFVIIPVSLINTIEYLQNTSTSTLSLFADIEAVEDGTKIQISTKENGSDGLVNVTGGTANAMLDLLNFNGSGNDIFVESALYQIGMEITVDDDDSAPVDTTITAITPDDPVTGTTKITTADPMGAFTVAQNATVARRSVLAFSTTPAQGVDGYKFYTGLLRTVQRTVDGLDQDEAFPGIKAAGVQIEVLAPTVQKFAFEIDVFLTEGLNISIVVDDIKGKVSNYVNGLGVGQDVILTEIIERIMSVDGITDVSIINPLVNIPIADNEIARVNLADISIG